MMGKAAARRIAILDRREHRAEEQHEAVGILMMLAARLRNEIERIAADFAHMADAFEHEAVLADDVQGDAGFADRIERERLIEQPHEWPDCARAVVVFRLAE